MNFQRAFDDVIPRRQVRLGFRITQFNCNGNCHVTNRTDAYGARRNGEKAISRLSSPAIAEIPIDGFILQIKLKVISE